MLSKLKLNVAAVSAVAALAMTSGHALAQKKYDTGATDTEIKIGNIMPYSGPASAYGVIGKTEQAYFNKINAEGGINGRQDQLHFLRRCLLAAEGCRTRPASWSRAMKSC